MEKLGPAAVATSIFIGSLTDIVTLYEAQIGAFEAAA